jgi:predicted RNase H-like HicB family nuclease
LLLSAYNLDLVKSRARPQDPVGEYQATRSPPDAEAPADARDVPYPVTLVRDETNGAEWVATVDVLPGCNARGSTPDEALERVAAAVAEWVAVAGREGKEIPEPKSAQSHSGRLLLRMPQTLHAELARAAERERVSLNQFITDALSGSLGWRAPNRETARATRVVPEEQLEGEPGTRRWQERPRVSNALFIANLVVVGLAAIVAIAVLIATVR